MKKTIIFITLFISVQVIFGQNPYTLKDKEILNNIEIGISFPEATNLELKKYVPKYKPKKVAYKLEEKEGEYFCRSSRNCFFKKDFKLSNSIR